MIDSPQQVQEEHQAQLDFDDHNRIELSDDSIIPESVSVRGQNHLPDASCSAIHRILEMPLASDVEETRDLCTDSDTLPTTMETHASMLTSSTPQKYPLCDRQKHRKFK